MNTTTESKHGLEYNSQREDLIISEYGRHLQKMVQHCTTIEDREERNKVARDIIDIMGQLFPHLRDVDDFKHKLWDHLFIMSKFQLDVDSPYPKPEPQQFLEKPQRIDYPKGKIRYGHYGRLVPTFIGEALKSDSAEDRKSMAVVIANLMKRSYLQWNRDAVRDDVIIRDLEELSNGQLTVEDPNLLMSVNELSSGGGSSHHKKKKRSNKNSRKKKN